MKMSDKAANAQIKTLKISQKAQRTITQNHFKDYMKVSAPQKQIVTTSGVAKEIYTELQVSEVVFLGFLSFMGVRMIFGWS